MQPKDKHKRSRASQLTTLLVLLLLATALGLGLASHFGRAPWQEAPSASMLSASTPPAHGEAAPAEARNGFFHPQEQPAGEHSALYLQAWQAYSRQAYQEGCQLVAGHWPELMAENEGCELLISLHAGAADLPQLEAVARLCLQESKAAGMAAEGVAYSMSAQGKVDEALALLMKQGTEDRDERTSIALARLLIMVGRDAEAQDLFAGVVGNSATWSLWLGEALKVEQLTGDAKFVKRLVQLVAAKDRVIPSLEKRLLELARRHSLAAEQQLLQQRLTKAEGHESA